MKLPRYHVGDKVEILSESVEGYTDKDVIDEKSQYKGRIGTICNCYTNARMSYSLFDVEFADGLIWCYGREDIRHVRR